MHRQGLKEPSHSPEQHPAGLPGSRNGHPASKPLPISAPKSKPPRLRRSHTPEARPKELEETSEDTVAAFIVFAKEQKAAESRRPPANATPSPSSSGVVTPCAPPLCLEVDTLHKAPATCLPGIGRQTSSCSTCTEGAISRHASVEDTLEGDPGPVTLVAVPTATSTPGRTTAADGSRSPRVSRPCSLSLSLSPQQTRRQRRRNHSPPASTRHSVTHRRAPSNAGSDKSAGTPVPDPPLFSPVLAEMGPLGEPVVECYQPRPPQEAAPAVEPLLAHLAELPAAIAPSTTGRRAQTAVRIASRLAIIGDSIDAMLVDGSRDEFLGRASMDMSIHQLSALLNWRSLGDVFSIVYQLFDRLTQEPHPGNEQLIMVERLWSFLRNTVSKWVWKNGGWGTFLGFSSSDGSCYPAPPLLPLSSPALAQYRRCSRIFSLSDDSGIFRDQLGAGLPPSGTPDMPHFLADVAGADSSSDLEESLETSSSFHGSGEFPFPSDLFQSLSPHASVVVQDGGYHGNAVHGNGHDGGLHDSGIVSSVEMSHGTSAPQPCFLTESHPPPSPLLHTTITMATCPGDHLTSVRSVPNLDSSEQNPFDRNRSMSLPLQRRRAPRRSRDRLSSLGLSAAVLYEAIRHLFNG